MTTTSFFHGLEDLRILIVGDVMIDRYLYGSVERISPEAPVPVVHLKSEDNRLGGAANVALNIRAMGATPLLFSVIGDDDNGRLLREQLPAADISPDYMLTDSERTTTVKTRVIAQHQHLLRVDREDISPLTPEMASRLVAAVRQCVEETAVHLILFQDYNKGVLTPDVISGIIDLALAHHIPTAVDPKYDNFWAYRNVTLFKPNLREIQQQLDAHLRPERAALMAADRQMRERLGNAITMITLSDKGVFIADGDRAEIIPTQARTIADVCGAGDTVISIMALGLAQGLDMAVVARLANLAGGQVCEKVGVVPVDKQQLEQEFKNNTTN